jgi:hypothetical protein
MAEPHQPNTKAQSNEIEGKSHIFKTLSIGEFDPNALEESTTQHVPFSMKELHDLRQVHEKCLHEKFYFLINHCEQIVQESTFTSPCSVLLELSVGTTNTTDDIYQTGLDHDIIVKCESVLRKRFRK